MKLAELENASKGEQYKSIVGHKRLKLIAALTNPEQLRDKVLCFIGNYAGFQTEGLVIRKFVYNFDTQAWIISDRDMSDGFEEMYDNTFKLDYLMEREFGSMYEHEGYLLDRD